MKKKKQFYNILFSFAFLMVNSVNVAYAQSNPANYDPFTREVIVTTAEETIHAHILDEKKKIAAKPSKKYTWYTRNMLMETQGGFSGKVLHGPYQSQYRNQQVKAEGNYQYGLKDKEWRSWNKNGQLTTIYTWSKGVKNGTFSEYENGELVRQGRYKNGQLHCTLNEYDKGEVVNSFCYRKGKKQLPKEKAEKPAKEKQKKSPKVKEEKQAKTKKEKPAKSKGQKKEKDE